MNAYNIFLIMLLQVGKTFTVPEKYLSVAPFAAKCPTGKVCAVVRRVNVGGDDREEVEELFYKCYNHIVHVKGPPSTSDAWSFIKCADFLSTNAARRMMNWDSEGVSSAVTSTSTTRHPRPKRST